MPVIPRAYWHFDSVGLLLRSNAESPDQDDSSWEMLPTEAVHYVTKIGQFIASVVHEDKRIFPYPTSISLLGGEPFNQPTALETLLARANEYRLVGEIWSTASWVRSHAHAVETLTPLKSRIHALRIHTNSKLLSKIGIRKVEDLVNAAREVGVAIYVRCGVGPGFPLPRGLFEFEAMNSDTSFIHPTPIYDNQEHLGAERTSSDFFMRSPSRQRCAEKFSFIVVPGGDIYPCLAGAGLTQLRIGSLANQEMADLIATAVSDRALHNLRKQGPRPLYDQIAATSAAQFLRGGYLDPCDFHRHMLMTPELAAAVQERDDESDVTGESGEPIAF